MAVPKKKTSKMKRNQRRAHDALKSTNWGEDSHSGETVRRHHIDLKTGMYRGRQVITEKE